MSSGMHADSIMKAGQLVPDTMMLRLILNELNKRGWVRSDEDARSYTLNCSAAFPTELASPSTVDDVIVGAPMTTGYTYSNSPAASFILDGFPRNVTQAIQVDNLIPINLVIHLDTPTEVIMDRIRNRWVHARSGRTYNLTFNPPEVEGLDDVTGEELERRADDNEETWNKRLDQFQRTSAPLLEHYDRRGLLWKVTGNSSDEISPKLFKEFERRYAIDDAD
jgi:adenylate kinase